MPRTIETCGQHDHDEYFELIQIFPLRVIRSDEELKEAIEMANGLLDKCNLGEGGREYLEALTAMIEQYEAGEVMVPEATDAQVLAHLIEAKGVKQAEVAEATGIVASTISDVLHGRRAFSRVQIGKIARFFRVSPTVFSFSEPSLS